MPQTILVVDDEQDIVALLKYNFEKHGYNVLTARNGTEALRQAQNSPDLITLDVIMPDLDGWEVARQLKGAKHTFDIPILLVTAKDSEVDEIFGFELGAVDYIRKPINMGAFLARVRSALRQNGQGSRRTEHSPNALRIGKLFIDVHNFIVNVDNREIDLAKKEFQVLAVLAQNSGCVVSREVLIHSVWGENTKVIVRTLDVHIRKIREKLGEYGTQVTTMKGVGYKLTLNHLP